jgi:peptidoglycan hydrolase-like protein with peptidoglycan-binding domain
MRSLSYSFLRSRVLWRLLAVAGFFALPTPSLGSPRSIPEISTAQAHEFSIAQAEAGTEETPNPSDAATENNPDTTEDTRDLQLGDTDPRVLEIQRLLALSGYYEGEPTGIFDISTDLAVSRFQESHNLEANGIVDSVTWERLQLLDSASSGSETDNPSAAPAIEEPKDTSSRPEAGSGSFSKLMLWLSLLIVTIGVVGMVFYWLLRLFEGDKPEADTGDFDEFTPEISEFALDPLGGELAQQAAEQAAAEQAAAEQAAAEQAAAEQAAAEQADRDHSGMISPPIVPTHLPSDAKRPEANTADPSHSPPPLSSPTPDPPAQSAPAPVPTPIPAQTPPPAIAAPSPLPSPPPSPPTQDVSISMASLPLATPATAATSLSTVVADASLSSEIVSAKVSITERLLQDLHHPEPSQRKKAIWELGRRGDSRAIQPLVNLMLQSDSQQRSLILAVLAEINTRSLEPMQQALALSFQDDSPEVRKNALRDLTRIFDSMAQMGYFISSSVYDRDPSVRETAKWAMAQLERIRTSAGVDRPLPEDQPPPP